MRERYCDYISGLKSIFIIHLSGRKILEETINKINNTFYAKEYTFI